MSVLSVYASEELQKLLFGDAPSVRHTAGTILLDEGEKCVGLFLIRSGRVRLSMSSDDLCIEQIMEAGCILGVPAAVNGKRYSLRAELVQDCDVAFLAIEQFIAQMKSNPNLALMVLGFLSREVQALRKSMSTLGKPRPIQ